MTSGSQQRSILVKGFYALTLLPLLLALVNPEIPLGHGPVDLLLLMDESNSIKPQHNDQVWQSFMTWSDDLPAGSRISMMRFAGQAKLEIDWIPVNEQPFSILKQHTKPPRRRALDQNASDIKQAIKVATRQVSALHYSALLISSDGIESAEIGDSKALVLNENSNLSLFYLPAMDKDPKRTLHIESINLPSSVVQGESLPVSICIESIDGAEGKVEISLNNRIIREHSLSLQAGERQVLIENLSAGLQDVNQLQVVTRDAQNNLVNRQRHVVSLRDKRQLLYIGKRFSDLVSRGLQQNGWQTTVYQPQTVPVDDAFFGAFDLVILDDLQAAAIDPAITRNLSDAIEYSATGLIVVGGVNSFGSGGYRHSALEKLLPVLSEPSRPLPASAFVFLLDKSGSMEASKLGRTRLADALRAVSESAKSLRAGDQSALLVFDRDARQMLPLGPRNDHVGAMDQPWRIKPSGGTLLVPAMQQAIDRLENSAAKERHIILVTDGSIGSERIDPLRLQMQQADIQLIVLAIGKDADLPTLRELISYNGGQLLQIRDTAQLPSFMRRQLESTQQSWQTEAAIPHTRLPVPFVQSSTDSWLELKGYQLTRAKPSAQVFVSNDHGDPLLAVGQYGAGRVAVLPGGILQTRSAEDFFSRFLAWMNTRHHNPNLQVSDRYRPGRWILRVDAVDQNNRWHSTGSADVVVTSPGGLIDTLPLRAIAPGRFETGLMVPSSGVYSARIRVGDDYTMVNAHLSGDQEQTHHVIAPWLEQALSRGDIKPWNETAFTAFLQASSGTMSTQPVWLLLALVCYVLLMAAERGPGFKAWLSHTGLKH